MNERDNLEDLLDFDEEDEKPSRIFGFLTVACLVIAIAGLTGVVWYAYQAYKNNENDREEIPILTADNAAVKIKPSEQGGIEIADTDKEFFANINEKAAIKNEKLAESSEEPIDKSILNPEPVIALQPATTGQQTATVQPTAPVIVAPTHDVFSVMEESPEENIVTVKAEPLAPAAPLVIEDNKLPTANDGETIKPKAQKFIQKPLVSAAAKKNTQIYRVQIASFSSKQEAIKYLQDARGRNAILFDGLESHIQSKNMHDKGWFYRLQIGAFADEEQAKKLCKDLKKNNYECFVAKS